MGAPAGGADAEGPPPCQPRRQKRQFKQRSPACGVDAAGAGSQEHPRAAASKRRPLSGAATGEPAFTVTKKPRLDTEAGELHEVRRAPPPKLAAGRVAKHQRSAKPAKQHAAAGRGKHRPAPEERGVEDTPLRDASKERRPVKARGTGRGKKGVPAR